MRGKTVFQEVMGASPATRVIEFLIEWGEKYDLTLTDISRGANISRTTAYDIVERLTQKEILKKTRRVGASHFYETNKENQVVRELKRLFNSIIKNDMSSIN